MTIVACLTSLAFALFGIVHVYWAFGGRFGKAAAVPTREGRPAFSPSPALTLAVAIALVGCAAVVALASGLVALPPELAGLRAIAVWLAYGLALVLLLRAIGDFRLFGFFKRVRGTGFARIDSLAYSPIALALAVAVFATAWWPVA